MSAVLLPGDCRDVMFDLLTEGEQFDSVITDPPYELTSIAKRFGKEGSAPAKGGVYARSSGGFMGKQWDATGISYDPDMWRQAYDLLKPGGYLAAFGGTRTYHRIAVAIEDAGFELRDTLSWMFGVGFPKSHDVSKQIDKAAGAVREVVGRAVRPDGSCRVNINKQPGTSFDSGSNDKLLTAPATPEAARWQGFGTALKPAYEPIILARKPLAGTVAQNVLAYGTGAMNIDACRVPASGRPLREWTFDGPDGRSVLLGGMPTGSRAVGTTDEGRWPANVIHDGSDDVLAAFARFGERASGGANGNRVASENITMRGPNTARNITDGRPADSGTAARFFPCTPWGEDDIRFHYSGKANKAERWEHCKICHASHPARQRAEHTHGLNTTDHLTSHPTVKPLALMRWLITLLTQPGGRVLDPFAGTGSTLHAAWSAGFHAVGIERDPEYQADILARLADYSLNN